MQERYKKDGNGALKCKFASTRPRPRRARRGGGQDQGRRALRNDRHRHLRGLQGGHLPVSAVHEAAAEAGPRSSGGQPSIAKAEADDERRKAKKEEPPRPRARPSPRPRRAATPPRARANATLSALEGETPGLRPLKIARKRARAADAAGGGK